MWNFIFFYLEPICFFLNSLALIYFSFKINHQLKYKVLAVSYFVGALILSKASQSTGGSHVNTDLYNILYVITTGGIGYYFLSTLTSKTKRACTLIVILIVILYYLIHNFVGDEKFFDSMGYVISSTGIVVMIFMFIHQMINNVTDEPLSLNFDFWFVCSQLFYCLGSFAVFLTYNYFTLKVLPDLKYEIQDLLTYLWAIPILLLFLSTLTTGLAVVWISSQRKPST